MPAQRVAAPSFVSSSLPHLLVAASGLQWQARHVVAQAMQMKIQLFFRGLPDVSSASCLCCCELRVRCLGCAVYSR